MAVLAAVSIAVAGCPAKPKPQPPVRPCESVLRFVAPEEPAVQVLGEWDAFAGEAMTRRADGTFEWKRTLEARSSGYAYRFERSDGGLELDPLVPETRWVSEVEQSRLRVPDCAAPLLAVTSFSAQDGGVHVVVQASRGSAGTALSAPVVTLDREPAQASWNAASGELDFGAPGLSPGKHTVTVALADTSGAQAEPLLLPFWLEAAPFDWRDATLYFAFTDRFRNGDPSNDAPIAGVQAPANYQGGDLVGLRQAVEDGYFDRLGVRAIWLSPLDGNPEDSWPGTDGRQYSGYHGYWPAQARSLERRFGTLKDLRALTAAAHARGIRVVADLVLNQLHQEHPYFVAHQHDGWFNVGNACICGATGCDWDSHALTCWFTSYLPDLDYRSTPMTDQLASDVRWWLEQGDLDGFRIDAAKHLLHTAIRAVRGVTEPITAVTGTPYYLVGESFTGAGDQATLKQHLGPHELDGSFDFPLYWPLVDAFANARPFGALGAAMATNDTAWPAGTLNSPFLGNHDLPRFISQAGGHIGSDPAGQAWSAPPPDETADAPFQRATWAFTFLFGQPGVPLVYYGDEVGLSGAGDPDNRRMMPWTGLSARQEALRAVVQQLGLARQASVALRRGTRKTLALEDDLLVFQRSVDQHVAVVAINRAATDRTVTVTLQGPAGATAHSLHDALSTRTAQLGGGQTMLVVPARTSMLLVEP